MDDREQDHKLSWIKVYRKILNWQWYTDIPVCHFFIHCCIKVNYKNNEWRGIKVSRASFVTSMEHLSKESGLSIQNIRTAIKKLTKTGELTCKSTSQYTVITVNNWIKLQSANKQITNDQQTANNRLTTTKEHEKEKNKKNKNFSSQKNITNSWEYESEIVDTTKRGNSYNAFT